MYFSVWSWFLYTLTVVRSLAWLWGGCPPPGISYAELLFCVRVGTSMGPGI